MLSLTRWNPFEDLTSLHREMDRVFGRYVGDERAGAPAAWIPATEVNSGEDGWKIRVALPGIDPQDVHIDLHGNSLTLSGERTRTETNGQGWKWQPEKGPLWPREKGPLETRPVAWNRTPGATGTPRPTAPSARQCVTSFLASVTSERVS